jgi:MFS family permease
MDRAERRRQWRENANRVARSTGTHLERVLGGPQRSKVIILLACVLALNSADASTVGASATQLRSALHIDNTDIGLLVTVNSLVAAVASIPFGVVADRMRRTRILGVTIILWGVAMLWSATAGSFDKLLMSRLILGLVTAAAGPIVGSLIGDYFHPSERGRIFSYILTGELAGAGIGFAVTGDIAALSWRAAFVFLALPAFVLAWYVIHLPEPLRGGREPLPLADGSLPQSPIANGTESGDDDATDETDAQRLAAARGVTADPSHVMGAELQRLGVVGAVRAVLSVKTNVTLIIASACGYFYLAGIETFAVEFVKEQYGVDQALANLLLLVLGAGAVGGVLLAGSLSDRFLQRGFLNARILVPAIGALLTAVLFLPAIFTRSAVTAVPYLTLAAFMLSAQNPPLDAARLDIMPALLWGRAEGVRTSLRTLAQSLAPLVFGAMSEHVFGGGRGGLQWTFALTLATLAVSGVILLRAMRTYPRDVATAAASTRKALADQEARAPGGQRAAQPQGATGPDARPEATEQLTFGSGSWAGPPPPPPPSGSPPMWPKPLSPD